MTLDGKAGVVTGAGRGIGRELAIAMAREGAAIVVNDAGVAVDGAPSSEQPSELVADEIRRAGGRAISDAGSVASWDDAQAMIGRAVREFGTIDFVVNNAGIVRDSIFHKMSPADWNAVIEVHLTGSFNVARAAADRFRHQQSGAVLTMTSTSGLIGNYGQANYAAAKLGLVALTRAIALDMRRFGVRANAIAPFAWTRITETIPDNATDDARQRIDRLRALKAEQIAPLAIYLVSDAASDVTGQVFAVRGAEIVLFSHPRPLATLHQAGGWTAVEIAARMSELQPKFTPLQVTADIFAEDPRL